MDIQKARYIYGIHMICFESNIFMRVGWNTEAGIPHGNKMGEG